MEKEQIIIDVKRNRNNDDLPYYEMSCGEIRGYGDSYNDALANLIGKMIKDRRQRNRVAIASVMAREI